MIQVWQKGAFSVEIDPDPTDGKVGIAIEIDVRKWGFSDETDALDAVAHVEREIESKLGRLPLDLRDGIRNAALQGLTTIGVLKRHPMGPPPDDDGPESTANAKRG